MKEDINKINNLNISDIKNLVSYYNISKNLEDINKINFSISFDKDKIHNLFYREEISYSNIYDKEFYILPILLDGNDIFIFSNNSFYDNWNSKKRWIN